MPAGAAAAAAAAGVVTSVDPGPARLFDALARRPATATALVGSDRSWSIGEVLAASAALAESLRGCGALGVLADNSPAWVVADLAALLAGVPRVPLPAFFTDEQLAHVLDTAGVDTLLTDQPGRVGALDAGFLPCAEWQGLARWVRPRRVVALPEGTGVVSFTSGSTGSPKGVCLAVDGLVDAAAAVARRLADVAIDRHLAVLPLALLLENVAGVYAPLLRGAEVALPPLAALGWRGAAGFDPWTLQDAAVRWQPHSAILVPELLKAWTLALAAAGARAPSGLAYVAVGGARVDPGAIAAARAAGIPAYQGYGLTECGSVVCLNRPGDDGDGVGRPLDHVAVHVEDAEVRVAGRAFRGYLGAGANAGRGQPAFATGDLGRIDADGQLHLAGRRGNLLITSFGRNVAPEWVEAALLAQPAIAQAVVTGDARPWLAAVLVPAPGHDGDALARAVAAANARLPDYARLGGYTIAAPFTLRNGQATGNGRPVRAAVLDHHAAAVAAVYNRKEAAHAVS
jgi:long-subunit acyl-CoA synthetase (AMP-forming)